MAVPLDIRGSLSARHTLLATAALLASTSLASAQTVSTEDSLTLPTIEITGDESVVNTTAGPVQGYRAFSATSATRTGTPIENIPQSIQVVPRKVIDDQQADSVTDAVRNVSGVQGKQNRERTQQIDGDYLIRGQFTELYVNGRMAFFDTGLDPRSMINVERVEVLKGPTSALFTAANGAPVSGVVNLVEKKPERDAAYMVTGGAGSFDAYSTAFDFNQPLLENKQLSLRVTGELQTSEDYVDRIDDRTVEFFPSLRFNDDTSDVTLRARYHKSDFLFYNGLPTDGESYPAAGIDRRAFVGAFDQPDSDAESYGLDIEASRKLSSKLTARFQAGYQTSEHTQVTSSTGVPLLFGFFGTPGDALVRADSTQLLEVETMDIRAELVHEDDLTDTWSHTLLVGVEHQATDSDGTSLFGAHGSVNSLSDLQAIPFDSSGFPASPFGLDLDTSTAVFQSQSTFSDRLHVLGGLSVSNTSVDTRGQQEINDVILSPRFGVAVEAGYGFTPFAGWGRGFRTPQGVTASAITRIESIEIERNEQFEVGTRFSFDEWGLSGSAAVYHLAREDAAVFVTTAAQTSVIDVADQTSQGFEVDMVYQPTASLSVLANYAFTDAKIDDGDSDFDGRRLQRVPKHSGRIAVRYDFQDGPLEGLGMGAGMTALTKRAGDLGNTFFTGGYTVFDAQASLRRGPVEASVGIENLLDREAFDPNFFSFGNVAPNQPFTVAGRLKVRF